MAEWLTYADIEQLKRMNRYYGCENQNSSSKYDLIRSLLQRMNKKNQLEEQIASLDKYEFRFLQLIMLDPSLQYSMEELLRQREGSLGRRERRAAPVHCGVVEKRVDFSRLFPSYAIAVSCAFRFAGKSE